MAAIANMMFALLVHLCLLTLCLAAPSWKKVTVSGSYVGRGEAAVSLCAGNKVCVLGGRGSSPVGIFDTEKLEWTKGKNPPFEIHHFQALQGPDDCVWVVAAWTGPYPVESNVDNMLKYCPKTDTWENGPAIARPRGSGGAFLRDGAIYLISGNVGGHNKDAKLVPWFDKYDLETKTWSELPDIPHPRDHFHAVVLNNKLYVAGGRDSSGDAPDFFADVEAKVNVYDFASGKWSVLDDFDRPRGGTFATAYDGTVYVMGGEGEGRAWTEVDILKGTKFTPGEDMPTPRHGAGAVSCNGAIWVAGGVTVLGGGAPAVDTVAFFDGDTPPACTSTSTPPSTEPPSTEAPTTEAPSTDAPSTDAPSTSAATTTSSDSGGTTPTTEAPSTSTTGMSTSSTITTTVTTSSTNTESIPTTAAPSTATSATTVAPSTASTATTVEPSTASSATTTPSVFSSPTPFVSPVVSNEIVPTITASPTDFASASPTPIATDVFETFEPTTTPILDITPDESSGSVLKTSPDSPDNGDSTTESDGDSTALGESPSPEEESDSGPVCFPSDGIVELPDGSTKTIADLQIGDHVKVQHPNGYSPVFFFSHRHHGATTEMVRIETSIDGVAISLSPGHLIYANNKLVPASTVRAGDKVLVGHVDEREAVVTSVSRINGQGLHNPHTLHGDIIVNGVVASTFTSAVHPSLARALLAPFRLMYHALGSHATVTGTNDVVLRILDYTVWKKSN